MREGRQEGPGLEAGAQLTDSCVARRCVGVGAWSQGCVVQWVRGRRCAAGGGGQAAAAPVLEGSWKWTATPVLWVTELRLSNTSFCSLANSRAEPLDLKVTVNNVVQRFQIWEIILFPNSY